MTALKARVHNGRLILDEATALPEGTTVDLVAADDGDDLDDHERAALHQAIDEGLRQADAREVVDAAEVLAWLRARAS